MILICLVGGDAETQAEQERIRNDTSRPRIRPLYRFARTAQILRWTYSMYAIAHVLIQPQRIDRIIALTQYPARRAGDRDDG
jgi:hypothetical protein